MWQEKFTLPGIPDLIFYMISPIHCIYSLQHIMTTARVTSTANKTLLYSITPSTDASNVIVIIFHILCFQANITALHVIILHVYSDTFCCHVIKTTSDCNG